jgi:hypothetical protein
LCFGGKINQFIRKVTVKNKSFSGDRATLLYIERKGEYPLKNNFMQCAELNSPAIRI